MKHFPAWLTGPAPCNIVAVARGYARAQALSPERRSEIARMGALAVNAGRTREERARLGRLGTDARMRKLSPEQRSAAARTGALALNATLTRAQKREYGRRGALIAALRREAREAVA